MKLASLKAGGRDGTLIVVSRDLKRAVAVPQIARTMQQALDDWNTTEVLLNSIFRQLNDGPVSGSFVLAPQDLAAPLPRAFQWLDGSVYLSHAELLRKSRKADIPPGIYVEPIMYQGGSDSFAAPTDPILAADEAWGIDFEAEIGVVTDDVPMGTTAARAGSHIKLIMLANDTSLRNLLAEEITKGLGFVQSKPATAFSPIAITPDELGPDWRDGKIHLPILSHVNDKLIGRPNAGVDMYFDYPTLIAHAARTRDLEAGSIIGAGTVSNRDRSVGSSCLAEVRMIETINGGGPETPYLKYGDRVRIEMFDTQGNSVFGAIDQVVARTPLTKN